MFEDILETSLQMFTVCRQQLQTNEKQALLTVYDLRPWLSAGVRSEPVMFQCLSFSLFSPKVIRQ